LIWDLLETYKRTKDTEFKHRVFDFVLRCFRSDEPELYSPAGISFLCKLCKSGGTDMFKGLGVSELDQNKIVKLEPFEKGFMSHEELASLLTLDDIEIHEGLFLHHYGEAAVKRMIAVKKQGWAK
jgi:hypothetical protein